MKHLPLDPSIFIQNRKRFIERMEKDSIAIFNSNDEVTSNGDAIYTFRQNSDLYWLTGIMQEDTMLVLIPGNQDKKLREVLVLVRPNEIKEKWDGKRLRDEEAKKISGIKTVLWLDSLDAPIQAWLNNATNIYLNSNENDRKSSAQLTRDYRYIADIQTKFPLHQYKRSASILKELRGIKTKEEITVISEAINITHNTFERLLKFIKPGAMEYEIEAEIVHSFLSQRASGEAYNSIIASGDRARTLHYISNNNVCKDGELVLMDFGASYGGYNADLSRTVPVNGKFTKRQAEVYNACLHLHNYAKTLLKPGTTLVDFTDKVGEEAGKTFVKIGLLKESDIKNEDAENKAYKKFLYHGISHHLGIDVHDLGTRTGPLQPGMVLTVEPGIYIEDEKMGIRIENNICITENGHEDLMKNIPITVEDIESRMKK
ncbi:MAG: aminopeptidase P family protein [Flavitalea sp.]